MNMRRNDSSGERSQGSNHSGSDHSVDSHGSLTFEADNARMQHQVNKGHDQPTDSMNAKAKNREHAKNTRLRKRVYIDSLKDRIKSIAAEREKLDRDRTNSLNRYAEQVAVRKKVLSDVLALRAKACLDKTVWQGLIEETFVMVLPITPYRSFSPEEVLEGQRVVKGIDGLIRDNASFDLMTQSITPPTSPEQAGRRLEWRVSILEIILNQDSLMCKWDMVTDQAVLHGARYEVTKSGMIKAIFSSSNKLLYMEEIFDVMSFMQQLRRASGRADFLVIPNTVPLAKEYGAKDARVITDAASPNRIVFVSPGWQQLFGFSAEEAMGQTCRMLQGPQTDREHVRMLMDAIHGCRPFSIVLKNYTRAGEIFNNWIRVFPLYTQGNLSHFLGVMEKVEQPLPSHAAPLPAASASSANAGQSQTSQSDKSEATTAPSPVSSVKSHALPHQLHGHSQGHVYHAHASHAYSKGSSSHSSHAEGKRTSSLSRIPSAAGVGLHGLIGPDGSTLTAIYDNAYCQQNSSSADSDHNQLPNTHHNVIHGITIDNINTLNQQNSMMSSQNTSGYDSSTINSTSSSKIPSHAQAKAKLSASSQPYRRIVVKKQPEPASNISKPAAADATTAGSGSGSSQSTRSAGAGAATAAGRDGAGITTRTRSARTKASKLSSSAEQQPVEPSSSAAALSPSGLAASTQDEMLLGLWMGFRDPNNGGYSRGNTADCMPANVSNGDTQVAVQAQVCDGDDSFDEQLPTY